MKLDELRYRFAAGSQQIFPVHIDGRVHIVRFSERNQFGNSVFFTKDHKVAEAIRRMPMFKRGAISEITGEEEKKALDAIVETRKRNAEGKPYGTEIEDVQAQGEASGRATGNEAEGVGTQEEETVKTFENYTLAKEWFCKTYGVEKGKIRKPETLAEYAKKYNVVIEYSEG